MLPLYHLPVFSCVCVRVCMCMSECMCALQTSSVHCKVLAVFKLFIVAKQNLWIWQVGETVMWWCCRHSKASHRDSHPRDSQSCSHVTFVVCDFTTWMDARRVSATSLTNGLSWLTDWVSECIVKRWYYPTLMSQKLARWLRPFVLYVNVGGAAVFSRHSYW